MKSLCNKAAQIYENFKYLLTNK